MAAARLSEAELIALRDFAGTFLLERAGDRLQEYDADKCGRPAEEVRQDEHELMIASAEVYGALRNVELQFSDLGTGRDVAEWVDVDFTKKALWWLRPLRDEIRVGLEHGRGSVESNENTADETYLLYILDGICDRGEG